MNVLRSLLGLFGKAKKKILGEKESSEYEDQTEIIAGSYSGSITKSGYESSLWDPQELGKICLTFPSH